jgi:atypical dual specificity phosphatase
MSPTPSKAGDGEELPPSTARETPRSILPPWLPPAQATSANLPGFHWVIIGKLAGMPRPGLLADEAFDLAALQALGIRHLVSLTRRAVDPAGLSARGIAGEHFPIGELFDLRLSDVYDLCRRISTRVDAAEPTVVHCRSGLLRTGTVLACTLVVRGLDPAQAIRELQLVNPRYVQHEQQLGLIADFGRELHEKGTLRPETRG